MYKWVMIVMCPECKSTKEIEVSQHSFKCPECKKKHKVAEHLFRRVKAESGADNETD